MKKSLIALAALATVATAAQAQSSVTMYGIMDAGVAKATNVTATPGSVTGLISGGLSTSRFGLRGSEDLGGGLAANFNLEMEIAIDTGVAGSTTVSGGSSLTSGNIFNRAANVELVKSGVGSLNMGRRNRLEYDLVVGLDPFAGANIGSFTRVGYIAGGVIPSGDARLADSVTVKTASFSGLTLSAQQSFGEQAGVNSGYRQVAYGAEYKNGPLMVAGTYAKNNASSGAEDNNVSLYGAVYDFGVVKVSAAHAEREKIGTAAKTKVDMIGAVVPVTSKINLIGNYITIKNSATTLPSGAASHTPVSGANADAFGLGLTYAFSKRTTAYVLYGNTDNEGGAKVYATSTFGTTNVPAANANTNAYAVGVRHSF